MRRRHTTKQDCEQHVTMTLELKGTKSESKLILIIQIKTYPMLEEINYRSLP